MNNDWIQEELEPEDISSCEKLIYLKLSVDLKDGASERAKALVDELKSFDALIKKANKTCQ